MIKLSAGKLKAYFLKFLNLAHKKSQSAVIITKRDTRVAQLIPYENSPEPVFSYMVGSLEIKGDIILSVAEKWDDDQSLSCF